MGRAKGNLIENLATLPWPAGVVFGVGGFFAIRTPTAEETHSDPVSGLWSQLKEEGHVEEQSWGAYK